MLHALVSLALAADPATVTAAPGKGFTVTSADGDFAMNLKARVQLRASLDALPDGELLSGAQVRTARLYWTGHVLAPENKYVVQLAVAGGDYRDGTISPIFDAYFDFDHNPNASVRVGQMFVPFDRLRTIREFALQITERPKPVSELTLDRDVGAYLYSDHVGGDDGVLAYRIGAFGGRGPNQLTSAEPGGLGVARLELNPFGPFDSDQEGDQERRAEPKLMLGAAAAYHANTTRQKSTTGTTYVGGTADYLHLAADTVLKWHGLALEGEYVLRDAAEDEITSTADDGTTLVELTQSGSGVVGQASYAFTPHVELAGRYSRLWAADGTDTAFVDKVTATGNEVAAGLNGYLNGHRFKVQGDWVALFGEPGFAEAQHSFHLALDVTM
jgi:hypothetical protein